jgi:hypothetical protein
MCSDVYIRAACHLRSVVLTIFITFEQRALIRHAVFACRKRINNPNTVNKLGGLTSANLSRYASPVVKNIESAYPHQGFYVFYTGIYD